MFDDIQLNLGIIAIAHCVDLNELQSLDMNTAGPDEQGRLRKRRKEADVGGPQFTPMIFECVPGYAPFLPVFASFFFYYYY